MKSEWQSIATAPRDQTEILLFELGRIVQGYWGGSFQDRFISSRDFLPIQYATHWMPLPAFPAVFASLEPVRRLNPNPKSMSEKEMKEEPAINADLCECQSWCQAGGKFIAAHHRNCRHYDLEGDAQRVIKNLLRGIEASAQDTDGIHPALWEAYKRGKASVWEFDWKEDSEN